MKRMITLSALLLAAGLAPAQYSVKKIDINKIGPAAGSEPRSFVEYKGRAYFTADDGLHGRELWWSDGEDAGMVADIVTGSSDGVPYLSDMCVVKDILYFCAYGQYGALWSFDGRNPPTIAASGASTGSASVQGLTGLDEKLYFLGGAGGNYRRLYKFDPDSAWWFKADSIPGTKGWYNFYQRPVVFKGRILYQAEIDTAIGRELYQFVPGQGFSLVADVFAGSGSSFPQSMYVLGDKLFFIATNPQYGFELYMWDGINPVQRVTDINKGLGNSFREQFSFNDGTQLIGYRGRLYFNAYNQKPINYPQPPGYYFYSFDPANSSLNVVMPADAGSDMAVYAGKLFFGGTFVYHHMLGIGNFGAQFTPPVQVFAPAVIGDKMFFTMHEPFGDQELHVLTDAAALTVAEAENSNEVKLYPNPVSTEATISFTLQQAAKLNVQLTDMQGRTVYTAQMKQYQPGNVQIKMPVQQLAAGNYIYAIMNETGEVMAKGQLVKE